MPDPVTDFLDENATKVAPLPADPVADFLNQNEVASAPPKFHKYPFDKPYTDEQLYGSTLARANELIKDDPFFKDHPFVHGEDAKVFLEQHDKQVAEYASEHRLGLGFVNATDAVLKGLTLGKVGMDSVGAAVGLPATDVQKEAEARQQRDAPWLGQAGLAAARTGGMVLGAEVAGLAVGAKAALIGYGAAGGAMEALDDPNADALDVVGKTFGGGVETALFVGAAGKVAGALRGEAPGVLRRMAAEYAGITTASAAMKAAHGEVIDPTDPHEVAQAAAFSLAAAAGISPVSDSAESPLRVKAREKWAEFAMASGRDPSETILAMGAGKADPLEDEPRPSGGYVPQQGDKEKQGIPSLQPPDDAKPIVLDTSEPHSKWSVDALKEHMGLSHEQATYTDALRSAMGISPEDIIVTHGGAPGEGALKQVSGARPAEEPWWHSQLERAVETSQPSYSGSSQQIAQQVMGDLNKSGHKGAGREFGWAVGQAGHESFDKWIEDNVTPDAKGRYSLSREDLKKFVDENKVVLEQHELSQESVDAHAADIVVAKAEYDAKVKSFDEAIKQHDELWKQMVNDPEHIRLARVNSEVLAKIKAYKLRVLKERSKAEQADRLGDDSAWDGVPDDIDRQSDSEILEGAGLTPQEAADFTREQADSARKFEEWNKKKAQLTWERDSVGFQNEDPLKKFTPRYAQYVLKQPAPRVPGGKKGAIEPPPRYREFVFTLGGEAGKRLDLPNPHWTGLKNAVLHLRVTDRMVNGERSLHAEEIQSDVHQSGRKYGYGNAEQVRDADVDVSIAKADAVDAEDKARSAIEKATRRGAVPGADNSGHTLGVIDAAGKGWRDFIDHSKMKPDEAAAIDKHVEARDRLASYDETQQHLGQAMLVHQDTPLKKEAWVKFGLNRIVTLAAKEGYSRLSMTSGDLAYDVYRPHIENNASGWRVLYNHDGTFSLTPLDVVTGSVLSFDKVGGVDRFKNISAEKVRQIVVDPKMADDILLAKAGDKVIPDSSVAFNRDMRDLKGEYRQYDYSYGRGRAEDVSAAKSGMRGAYDRNNLSTWKDVLSPLGLEMAQGQMDVVRPGEKASKQPVWTTALTPEARQRLATETVSLSQGDKASVEFLDNGKALMRAFQGSDVSSAVHELSHVARRFLLDRSVAPEARMGITDAHIEAAEKAFGVKDGEWTVAAEERFARGFEKYMRDGKAPSAKLADLFSKFREWLTAIYQRVKGTAISKTVSPEMRAVFDNLATRSERMPVEPNKAVERATGLTEPGGSMIPDPEAEREAAAARGQRGFANLATGAGTAAGGPKGVALVNWWADLKRNLRFKATLAETKNWISDIGVRETARLDPETAHDMAAGASVQHYGQARGIVLADEIHDIVRSRVRESLPANASRGTRKKAEQDAIQRVEATVLEEQLRAVGKSQRGHDARYERLFPTEQDQLDFKDSNTYWDAVNGDGSRRGIKDIFQGEIESGNIRGGNLAPSRAGEGRGVWTGVRTNTVPITADEATAIRRGPGGRSKGIAQAGEPARAIAGPRVSRASLAKMFTGGAEAYDTRLEAQFARGLSESGRAAAKVDVIEGALRSGIAVESDPDAKNYGQPPPVNGKEWVSFQPRYGTKVSVYGAETPAAFEGETAGPKGNPKSLWLHPDVEREFRAFFTQDVIQRGKGVFARGSRAATSLALSGFGEPAWHGAKLISKALTGGRYMGVMGEGETAIDRLSSGVLQNAFKYLLDPVKQASAEADQARYGGDRPHFDLHADTSLLHSIPGLKQILSFMHPLVRSLDTAVRQSLMEGAIQDQRLGKIEQGPEAIRRRMLKAGQYNSQMQSQMTRGLKAWLGNFIVAGKMNLAEAYETGRVGGTGAATTKAAFQFAAKALMPSMVYMTMTAMQNHAATGEFFPADAPIGARTNGERDKDKKLIFWWPWYSNMLAPISGGLRMTGAGAAIDAARRGGGPVSVAAPLVVTPLKKLLSSSTENPMTRIAEGLDVLGDKPSYMAKPLENAGEVALKAMPVAGLALGLGKALAHGSLSEGVDTVTSAIGMGKMQRGLSKDELLKIKNPRMWAILHNRPQPK